MKFSCIPHGPALGAALASLSSGAFAATGLQSLSESEMAGVHGRGLTEPTLSALGAHTPRTGLQANLKIVQTIASLNNALAPPGGNSVLPTLPFPMLIALPALPSPDAIQKKP